jgi:CubicO group peptidase (beta-lactamase class C family)
VTTTSIAQFYQRGEVELEEKVCDEKLLGIGFSGQGKDKIALLNLLLHNAGFPPDPRPNYWSTDFGCSETKKEHPLENFSCQDTIYSSLLDQTLDHPVGEKFVYSDLSMITMMYVIGKLARDLHYVSESDLLPGCDQGGPGALECYYEAYVRHFVLQAAHTSSSGFLPPQSAWENCAPTWNDTSYRHGVIQGTVSDGNSYALGGISGHAGFFATVGDVAKITRLWLYAGPEDKLLNETTVELFTTAYNLTQSSRALGWDTNDFKTNPSMWCGTLSQKSFLHLGYTGTEVCNDPDRQIFTILLTNRVYPVTTNMKIEKYRKDFNTLVQEILDDDHTGL